MVEEIPYHERIKNYSMDDLLDVMAHIDRENYPDRYELVLHEIEKRAAEIQAPPPPHQEVLPEETG